MVFELMTGVIPLMLSMGTCVGCITATLVILYRRKQRAEMTQNESADRALATLTLMLICFIVCFGYCYTFLLKLLTAVHKGGVLRTL